MIAGTTFHTGADLPRPGEDRDRKLEHSDVDNLYVRNSALRWVLIDEISMVADGLLGDFEAQFTNAARQTRYAQRADNSKRIFGGYNVLTFGDWWQLPPIPDREDLGVWKTMPRSDFMHQLANGLSIKINKYRRGKDYDHYKFVKSIYPTDNKEKLKDALQQARSRYPKNG